MMTTGRGRIPRGICAALTIVLATSACFVIPAGIAIGAGAGVAVGAARSPDAPGRTIEGIPVGAAIKVTLSPPRTLSVATQDTYDTTSIRNAHILFGRITSIRGDTIRLTVTEARLGDGRKERFRPESVVAAITRGPDIAIHMMSSRPGVMDRALIGAGFGFLVSMIILAACCVPTT